MTLKTLSSDPLGIHGPLGGPWTSVKNLWQRALTKVKKSWYRMRQWTIFLDQIRNIFALQIILLICLTQGQPPIGINWNLLTQSLQQQQQPSNYDAPLRSPANWVFIWHHIFFNLSSVAIRLYSESGGKLFWVHFLKEKNSVIMNTWFLRTLGYNKHIFKPRWSF